MQRYQDRPSDVRETETSPRLLFFAALGIVLLVIVALVTNYPAMSEWVSAAAQAEFVNPDITSAGPTQIAQPAEQMGIVRSN
jgi:Na+-transporting methylmalonyl-CoA/oxaloacetate decarboxylase gamma subunit